MLRHCTEGRSTGCPHSHDNSPHESTTQGSFFFRYSHLSVMNALLLSLLCDSFLWIFCSNFLSCDTNLSLIFLPVTLVSSLVYFSLVCLLLGLSLSLSSLFPHSILQILSCAFTLSVFSRCGMSGSYLVVVEVRSLLGPWLQTIPSLSTSSSFSIWLSRCC